MQDNSVFLSLIIPAYNEEDRIKPSIERVLDYVASLGQQCEVIIVDDGSTDSTLQITNEAAASSSVLRVVTYPKNMGKGYAVRRGVAESRGQLVGFTDADLSAPIEEMDKLIAAMEGGVDAAIGSRAIKGAVIPKHQPFYRELGGKGLNLIIRTLAVRGIHDTQCGFKLFTGELARDVFSRCFLDGWGFDVEVLYLSKKVGYYIKEVPVVWSHSEGSKIHPFSAAVKIIIDLVRMRLHRY